jgi:hypothetical protein
MYFPLSMGVPFVCCSHCCSQQLQPTPKGAPFYIAWPGLIGEGVPPLADFARGGDFDGSYPSPGVVLWNH